LSTEGQRVGRLRSRALFRFTGNAGSRRWVWSSLPKSRSEGQIQRFCTTQSQTTQSRPPRTSCSERNKNPALQCL